MLGILLKNTAHTDTAETFDKHLPYVPSVCSEFSFIRKKDELNMRSLKAKGFEIENESWPGFSFANRGINQYFLAIEMRDQ